MKYINNQAEELTRNAEAITQAMQRLEIEINRQQKYIVKHGKSNDAGESDKIWDQYKKDAQNNLKKWDQLKAARDKQKIEIENNIINLKNLIS